MTTADRAPTCARWRSPAISTTARRSSRTLFQDQAFARDGRPVGGQLDQLRAHRRPERLLLHRRRGAGRAGPAGVLRRADRQFRRRLRRLRGQRHGAADQPHHWRRPTATTSSRAPCNRRLPARRGGRHPEPGHGHPGRLELRAAVLRGVGSRRAPPPRAAFRAFAATGEPQPVRPRSVAVMRRAVPRRCRSSEAADRRARCCATLTDERRAGRPAHRRGPGGRRRRCAKPSDGAPLVTLSTAHPAKFPEAVPAATGVTPTSPRAALALADRPERFDRLPADAEAIKAYVRAFAAA